MLSEMRGRLLIQGGRPVASHRSAASSRLEFLMELAL